MLLLGAAGATQPTAVPTGADSGRALYAQRCAGCHGPSGAGDGLVAIGLVPPPRALRDPAWQASVTDAQIASVIVRGGAAFGKSALMAANPDLARQPDAVASLVAFVRSLRAAPKGP